MAGRHAGLWAYMEEAFHRNGPRIHERDVLKYFLGYDGVLAVG